MVFACCPPSQHDSFDISERAWALNISCRCPWSTRSVTSMLTRSGEGAPGLSGAWVLTSCPFSTTMSHHLTHIALMMMLCACVENARSPFGNLMTARKTGSTDVLEIFLRAFCSHTGTSNLITNVTGLVSIFYLSGHH